VDRTSAKRNGESIIRKTHTLAILAPNITLCYYALINQVEGPDGKIFSRGHGLRTERSYIRAP